MRRFILIVVLVLCARELRATVLVPADFREVVAGSQIIVYGRIQPLRPEWSDDRSRIDTVVSVMAGSYLKGGPAGTAAFRVPGGQISRYCTRLVDTAQFQ